MLHLIIFYFYRLFLLMVRVTGNAELAFCIKLGELPNVQETKNSPNFLVYFDKIFNIFNTFFLDSFQISLAFQEKTLKSLLQSYLLYVCSLSFLGRKFLKFRKIWMLLPGVYRKYERLFFSAFLSYSLIVEIFYVSGRHR